MLFMCLLPTLLQYNEDCDYLLQVDFLKSYIFFQPCSSTMRIATSFVIYTESTNLLPTLLQYNEDCDRLLQRAR